MDAKRHGRFEEVIHALATNFLLRESSDLSLITITKVEIDDRGEKSTIFISVFPDDKESSAIEFLKRKRSDFREFVKDNARLARIPFFDFEIDRGEKNRRQVEEASKKR